MRVWVVRGQQEALAALGRHAEAELAGAEHIALADRLEGRETADSPRPSPPSSSSSAAMASPHAPETSITLPPGPTAAPLLGGRTLVAALEDAHARVRRQPRWSEAPGTLGGRPQEDFQAEVDELIAGAHLQAAESLLLALLDCLDDAVDAGLGLDPMHYITLAGLFAQQMMPFEELATLTRLAEAFRRSGQEPPAAVMQQIESVEASIARLTEA